MRVLLLTFTFFSLNLTAQDISPKVKRLASRITNNINSDSLRFRALYEWVTENIAYDTEMLEETDNEKTTEAQNPEKVIKRKKAVCMGYSQLLRDLCLASGIKAHYVVGYCKNPDRRTGKLTVMKEAHAWNAIKINNNWYLCDPTWGAGYVSSGGAFIPQPNNDFYLIKGPAFIKRHIPSDPLWQLSYAPVSMVEFRNDQNPAEKLRFSYSDTLQVFETLAIEEQKLDSGLRSLRFDPTNDRAKTDVAQYYSKQAESEAKILEDLMASFIDKKTSASYKRATEEKDKMYNLLDSIEKNMTQARYYYSLVAPKSTYKLVANHNMRSAATYLSANKRNKADLNRYYKALEKMKF